MNYLLARNLRSKQTTLNNSSIRPRSDTPADRADWQHAVTGYLFLEEFSKLDPLTALKDGVLTHGFRLNVVLHY